MIFGAIVAGGIGTRMGMSDLPKQFMMLGNKPIIIHTLEKFLLCNRIDCIYVGMHKDWILYMDDLLNKYNIKKDSVKIVEGGKVRNDTVLNIINTIESDYNKDSNHIIVTHDAVRPFVTSRMINDSIDVAIKYGASDTVIPSADTIICSEDGKQISSVPKRSTLFLGQTPQTFNLSKLSSLYNELSNDEKSRLTDCCSIFNLKNQYVGLVMGESTNLKITTINDYKIAQAIIGGNFID